MTWVQDRVVIQDSFSRCGMNVADQIMGSIILENVVAYMLTCMDNWVVNLDFAQRPLRKKGVEMDERKRAADVISKGPKEIMATYLRIQNIDDEDETITLR